MLIAAFLCKPAKNYYNLRYGFTNRLQCDSAAVRSAPAGPSHLHPSAWQSQKRGQARWSHQPMLQMATEPPLAPGGTAISAASRDPAGAPLPRAEVQRRNRPPHGLTQPDPKNASPPSLWLMESQSSQRSWVTGVENLPRNLLGPLYNPILNLQLSQALGC